MLRRTALVLVSLVVVFAGTCEDGITGGDGVRGSGTLASESRDVSGFAGVRLISSGDIVIEVGAAESLTVEAEDNILPLLTSEVRGNVLELSTSESISPTRGIRYEIGAAELDSIEIIGSGDVTANGVDAARFEVEITGSGTVTPLGTADVLEVRITGSGDYEGEGLVATTGDVSVAGSGNVLANVTDTLDVGISGSGNVRYLGDPTVAASVTGSGEVSPG